MKVHASTITSGILPTSGNLIILVVLAGVFLAGVSYLTTGIYASGDLPPGKYQLRIRNSVGKPIQGAILTGKTYSYPTVCTSSTSSHVSNEQGIIDAYTKPELTELDAMGWKLFWVFPILPDRASKYECEITAQGYEPLRFLIADFFKVAIINYGHMPTTKVPSTYGDGEVDVDIYELDLTLREQKP